MKEVLQEIKASHRVLIMKLGQIGFDDHGLATTLIGYTYIRLHILCINFTYITFQSKLSCLTLFYSWFSGDFTGDHRLSEDITELT